VANGFSAGAEKRSNATLRTSRTLRPPDPKTEKIDEPLFMQPHRVE
jgi:hypothetical protein